MIKIYHNPRCGKSREGLQILEASEKAFKIIKYFDEPLSVDELQHIILRGYLRINRGHVGDLVSGLRRWDIRGNLGLTNETNGDRELLLMLKKKSIQLGS